LPPGFGRASLSVTDIAPPIIFIRQCLRFYSWPPLETGATGSLVWLSRGGHNTATGCRLVLSSKKPGFWRDRANRRGVAIPYISPRRMWIYDSGDPFNSWRRTEKQGKTGFTAEKVRQSRGDRLHLRHAVLHKPDFVGVLDNRELRSGWAFSPTRISLPTADQFPTIRPVGPALRWRSTRRAPFFIRQISGGKFEPERAAGGASLTFKGKLWFGRRSTADVGARL